MHGKDSEPDGFRLGGGQALLQLIDVQSGLRITDQIVVGDFNNLEGLTPNPRPDARSPFDLFLVNDEGSDDDGWLMGLRSPGLNGLQAHQFRARPGGFIGNSFTINPNDILLDAYTSLNLGPGFEASDIVAVPTEYGDFLLSLIHI